MSESGNGFAGHDGDDAFRRMSPAERKAHIERLLRQHEAEETQQRAAFVEATRRECLAMGWSIPGLIAALRTGKVAAGERKRPVRYRGPNGEEWAGVGKRAEWLDKLVKAGHSPDEFKV